jgi:hypothetical protein
MAVEEPAPKVEPACEGGDVAATLAPGASPPLGLDGPRHGAGGRNEKQAVAVAVGSRWSARSTHSSLASSRQRRTSAASGSSSLPRPPAPACASCDTSTSV